MGKGALERPCLDVAKSSCTRFIRLSLSAVQAFEDSGFAP